MTCTDRERLVDLLADVYGGSPGEMGADAVLAAGYRRDPVGGERRQALADASAEAYLTGYADFMVGTILDALRGHLGLEILAAHTASAAGVAELVAHMRTEPAMIEYARARLAEIAAAEGRLTDEQAGQS